MRRWDLRPFEIRNLFNPAFCGLVLFRALGGYEEQDDRGMPFSLSLLVLPMALQKDSREAIARQARGNLLKIMEKSQEIAVGLPGRTCQMIPYTFEAFGLLVERGCILISEDGRIKTVPNKVIKAVKGTPETISCQKIARVVGKEFARIGDRVTVYTSLGIRP